MGVVFLDELLMGTPGSMACEVWYRMCDAEPREDPIVCRRFAKRSSDASDDAIRVSEEEREREWLLDMRCEDDIK